MEHLRQKPRERREQVEDPFNDYVQDLIGEVLLGDLDSDESSPPPSPLVEVVIVSKLPTLIDPAPAFNIPSAPPSVRSGRNTVSSSAGSISQRIPTSGWIFIIAGATLVSIAAVVMVMSALFAYYGHETRYVEADETERIDERDEKTSSIPGTIVVSKRAALPESYSKLEDEGDPSEISPHSGKVPLKIHFRTQQQRGFMRLEQSDRLSAYLKTIPEERSLGDISSLYHEDYIFEDHLE